MDSSPRVDSLAVEGGPAKACVRGFRSYCSNRYYGDLGLGGLERREVRIKLFW